MNKKLIIISALILAGLALISVRTNPPPPDTSGILPGAASGEPPHKELAGWLLSEGRAHLRAGRLCEATETAVLAQILDAESGHESLTGSVEKSRAKIAGRLARDVKEAAGSGDARRLLRANSLSAKFKGPM